MPEVVNGLERTLFSEYFYYLLLHTVNVFIYDGINERRRFAVTVKLIIVYNVDYAV